MGYGKLPVNVERKEDCTENGSRVQEKVKAQRKREKNLYPLRINQKTIIFVTKEKCNENYRIEYLKRIGSFEEKKTTFISEARKSYMSKILTYDKLDATKHLTLKEAANQLGVSPDTVGRYRKKVLYGEE